MSEIGSPVLQGFCSACKNELDVTVLEPLDTFACRRCLTIQTFGHVETRPTFFDPAPKRVFVAMILIQLLVDGFLMWTVHRRTSRLGAIPLAATVSVALSIAFFLRVKSPPLNVGFAMISISVVLGFMAMSGFPVRQAGAMEEWTILVFALATILSLGLVFFVGELLRISRTTRA